MRVLIVGEGKHELSGALEALVRRLIAKPFHCDRDRVSRDDIHAHHGKGQGYFKKAIRWMLEARKRGYDALVLLIDQDNRPERVIEIKKAQEEYQTASIRRALGVAIRTFDAWILADERALADVLRCAVPCSRDPESITDPKSLCRR